MKKETQYLLRMYCGIFAYLLTISYSPAQWVGGVGWEQWSTFWVWFARTGKGNTDFVLKELWLYLLICLVASWGTALGICLRHAPPLKLFQDWSCFLGSVCWNNLKTYTAQLGQGVMDRASADRPKSLGRRRLERKIQRHWKASTYTRESGMQCMCPGLNAAQKRSEKTLGLHLWLIFGFFTSRWNAKVKAKVQL